jgi:hypothetical protein
MLARLSMTDFSASDDEGRWDADRAAFLAEAEQRSWENHGDRWREVDPDPAAEYRQRRTATASWQRSILIIAALSGLAWAGVTLVVIVALSAL